jgi:hypothetical protein
MKIVTVQLLLDSDDEAEIADAVSSCLSGWEQADSMLVDWAYTEKGHPDVVPAVAVDRKVYTEGAFLHLLPE